MELRRYLLLLRQRLVLIILTVVAGLAGGYLITNNTPVYRTQTSILVGTRDATSQSSNEIIQLDRIIATYAAMVKSTPVAQGAVATSHAPRTVGQVIGETTSVVVPNTNLISITVTDPDPGVAQAVANGVAASFITQVTNLGFQSGAAASSAPSVTIVQQASRPGAPLPTSLKRDLALGAIFGLIVSVGVVLILDYLDITIKSSEDLEHHLDLPVLGTIPLGNPAATAPMAMTA
jgi:capsular polysaccharide biosynthesis protein